MSLVPTGFGTNYGFDYGYEQGPNWTPPRPAIWITRTAVFIETIQRTTRP